MCLENRLEAEASFWPLSKKLLNAILEDRLSDRFVSELIWERLGYRLSSCSEGVWSSGPETPKEWSEDFLVAPEVIAQRRASVRLTRSIPKRYKQLLKEQMQFVGYRISELYPRRTRRATAVNWLLAWMAVRGFGIPETGPLPVLLPCPIDSTKGHPGDKLLE